MRKLQVTSRAITMIGNVQFAAAASARNELNFLSFLLTHAAHPRPRLTVIPFERVRHPLSSPPPPENVVFHAAHGSTQDSNECLAGTATRTHRRNHIIPIASSANLSISSFAMHFISVTERHRRQIEPPAPHTNGKHSIQSEVKSKIRATVRFVRSFRLFFILVFCSVKNPFPKPEINANIDNCVRSQEPGSASLALDCFCVCYETITAKISETNND